ncbi:MAG: hypothetical protein ACI4GO_02685 [Hominenteromicrobium sp.]
MHNSSQDGQTADEVMAMEKLELPLGFGMALAQNEPAMKQFESMTEAEKRAVLERAHSVRSKNEMRQLVAELSGNGMQA